MSSEAENKGVTIDDLAVMVKQGFERIETKLEKTATKEELTLLSDKMDRIENYHGRRLDLVEDKVQVMKTYFERNPKLKVKFG